MRRETLFEPVAGWSLADDRTCPDLPAEPVRSIVSEKTSSPFP